MKILVIEKERNIAYTLLHFLKTKGFIPIACYDYKDGFDEIITNLYDIIILDSQVYAPDGKDMLSCLIKAKITTPVIILSPPDSCTNGIFTNNCGIDCCRITMPVDTNVLLSCIMAAPVGSSGNKTDFYFTFGDIVLYPVSGILQNTLSSKAVKLTVTERNIMEILIKSGSNVVPKEQIISRIWNTDSDSYYNCTEVYISFLRKKLNQISSYVVIITSRCFGYSLNYDKR